MLGMEETAYIFREMSDEEKKLLVKELAGVNKVFVLGDIRLYECPLSWINSETAEMLRFCFLTDETSVIPFPGAWTDQPRWFVEAFELYKSEKVYWQMENMPKWPTVKSR